MSRRNNDYLDAKVYVGGLPEDATSQELEDAFHRFGRIRKVWVARRPPGFVFIEFEDARDAEDAVKGMDGNRICGTVEIVVETTRDRALARRTVDALVIAARRRVDLLAMTTIVDALDHLDKSKQSSWITAVFEFLKCRIQILREKPICTQESATLLLTAEKFDIQKFIEITKLQDAVPETCSSLIAYIDKELADHPADSLSTPFRTSWTFRPMET
ncbi:RNA recognition motif domain-containing protein [Ditylenchus destructor]|uniref:RNA recognition motif domain-containing protein n=1 Tax=Ditylenchus destructor TaxID=166010 RepID=A0AAD4MT72_9BILA|nr:RNA recognition motif domain-containing protein [Ditylenchus destructor]